MKAWVKQAFMWSENLQNLCDFINEQPLLENDWMHDKLEFNKSNAGETNKCNFYVAFDFYN